MKSLYLIQRGKINSQMIGFSTRLSKAVHVDYMGSSEFEWGALPQSFRRIEPNLSSFVPRTIEEIKFGKDSLVVWSYFSDEEFNTYKTELIKLREGTLDTKEYTGFDYHSKSDRVDFWWDIENDAMFCFDKKFAPIIGMHVTESIQYMNAQRDSK